MAEYLQPLRQSRFACICTCYKSRSIPYKDGNRFFLMNNIFLNKQFFLFRKKQTIHKRNWLFKKMRRKKELEDNVFTEQKSFSKDQKILLN